MTANRIDIRRPVLYVPSDLQELVTHAHKEAVAESRIHVSRHLGRIARQIGITSVAFFTLCGLLAWASHVVIDIL